MKFTFFHKFDYNTLILIEIKILYEQFYYIENNFLKTQYQNSRNYPIHGITPVDPTIRAA